MGEKGHCLSQPGDVHDHFPATPRVPVRTSPTPRVSVDGSSRNRVNLSKLTGNIESRSWLEAQVTINKVETTCLDLLRLHVQFSDG